MDRRAICRAYSAIHNANVITRQAEREHLMVRDHPSTGIRTFMESTEAGSSIVIKPKSPIILKVVGFDEAVDLSKLTPEERRAAIEKEREALQSTFVFRRMTGKRRRRWETKICGQGKSRMIRMEEVGVFDTWINSAIRGSVIFIIM